MSALPPKHPERVDIVTLCELRREVSDLHWAGKLTEAEYQRIWAAAEKACGGETSELQSIRMYSRPGWPGWPN